MHTAADIRKEHSTRLAELRRRIAVLEGRLPFQTQFGPAPASAANQQGPGVFRAKPDVRSSRSGRLPSGLQALDALFTDPGGLRQDGLHEVVSEQSRDAGSASGFTCALMALVLGQRSGPVLWVQEAGAVREAGRLHGPGLQQFGIDPARLIVVRPRRVEDALWALEEGAACGALAAVVGEVQGGHTALDLTATRRLALRAGRHAVPVLLLRHGAWSEPTAALTRWRILPGKSKPPELSGHSVHDGLGDPVWTVELTRNRDGRPGHLTVEWCHAARKLAAPAHSLALVRGPALGPDPAPPEARVLRWRAGG